MRVCSLLLGLTRRGVIASTPLAYVTLATVVLHVWPVPLYRQRASVFSWEESSPSTVASSARVINFINVKETETTCLQAQ